MFDSFLIRKLMESKLKAIPETEREKLLMLIQNNPELVMKIAQEIQEKIKAGQDHMSATMDVVKSHEEELKKLT